MLRLATLAFIGCTLGTVATAEQYICLAEQATGFINRDGKWESTNFKATSKFLVTHDPDVTLDIAEFGKSPSIYATWQCSIQPGGGWCANLFGQFTFVTYTLRYTRTFVAGFNFDDGAVTPLIEIGSCSKL